MAATLQRTIFEIVKIDIMKNLRSPLVLLTLCFSLLLWSCKKEDAPEISFPDSESKQLIGTWNWIGTYGGFTGSDVIDPSTEGYSQQIEFTNNGYVYEYQNGRKLSPSAYSLVKAKSIFNSEERYMLIFDKAPTYNSTNCRQSYQFSGSDSLILNEECYDAYGHLYVRL